MKSKEEIYVVTSGSYSDYAIDAIFTDINKAEEYKTNFNCDEVETHELNPNTVAFHMTVVAMFFDGTSKNQYELIAHENTSGFKRYVSSKYSYNLKYVLIWIVNTNDKNRAIKVVNEKRIQILAAGCWGDTEKTEILFNHTI